MKYHIKIKFLGFFFLLFSLLLRFRFSFGKSLCNRATVIRMHTHNLNSIAVRFGRGETETKPHAHRHAYDAIFALRESTNGTTSNNCNSTHHTIRSWSIFGCAFFSLLLSVVSHRHHIDRTQFFHFEGITIT